MHQFIHRDALMAAASTGTSPSARSADVGVAPDSRAQALPSLGTPGFHQEHWLKPERGLVPRSPDMQVKMYSSAFTINSCQWNRLLIWSAPSVRKY